MPPILPAETLALTEVTILPDLTPEELAKATIIDDPADFDRGMVVYKIEAIPSNRKGAASSLKYELKYAMRKQVPGVWLADYAEGEGFAAGIPAGTQCPLRTQLGRYTVTKIEQGKCSESLRDRIVGVIVGVLVGSKDVVVDLRDSVAFRCGLRQVQEMQLQEMQR